MQETKNQQSIRTAYSVQREERIKYCRIPQKDMQTMGGGAAALGRSGLGLSIFFFFFFFPPLLRQTRKIQTPPNLRKGSRSVNALIHWEIIPVKIIS